MGIVQALVEAGGLKRGAARTERLHRAEAARNWSGDEWERELTSVHARDRDDLLRGLVHAEEGLGWLPGENSGAALLARQLGLTPPAAANPYVSGAQGPWQAYSAAIVDLADKAPRTRPIWVVTACNPGAHVLPDAENAVRMGQLEQRVRLAGATYSGALGRNQAGTWSGPSYALAGSSRLQAVALARAFGQDAIFEVLPAGQAEVVPCAPLSAPESSPLALFLAHASMAERCANERKTFRSAVHDLASGVPLESVLRNDPQARSTQRPADLAERVEALIAATPAAAWRWPGLAGALAWVRTFSG